MSFHLLKQERRKSPRPIRHRLVLTSQEKRNPPLRKPVRQQANRKNPNAGCWYGTLNNLKIAQKDLNMSDGEKYHNNGGSVQKDSSSKAAEWLAASQRAQPLGQSGAYTKVREHGKVATCLREALRRRQGMQLANFFSTP